MTDERHTPGPDRDEALEAVLGNLLRIGVIVAAAVVGAGGVYLLITRGDWIPDFRSFQNGGSPLRSVPLILRGAFELRADAIVQTGLLLLIATPVLRVVFSLFGFAHERDWLFVALTMIVLAVLAVGISGLQT
jgi:uncharacterized membrane protein